MTLPSEFVGFVAALLDSLAIPYHVGGSVASSVHGMYRASADIDVVIDPTAEQLERLAHALESAFYVSRSAMAEALRDRSTFNAIHRETSFKIDFFVKGASAFDAVELERAVVLDSGSPAGVPVRFKTAEDTVLRKLEWFRRGGEVSDRQWLDVINILDSARGGLDEAHLDRWAAAIGVGDLLERARKEADGRPS
jgi:hypothetical protein